MAQRYEVILEDDLTGGKANETISFSFEGKDYEIDLSTKNATALRKAIGPYVEAARKATPARRRKASKASLGSARDIRAWAVVNGHELSERGRIPAPIREAYDAAH